MGFTQRQAGGKFTRDEADTFISQLETEAEFDSVIAEAVNPTPAPTVTPRPKKSSKAAAAAVSAADDHDLAGASDSRLAAELQRRGWVVMEP